MKQCPEILESLCIDAAVNALTASLATNETSDAQLLDVMGDGGRRHAEPGAQIADAGAGVAIASRAALEQSEEDGESNRMPQHLEELRLPIRLICSKF